MKGLRSKNGFLGEPHKRDLLVLGAALHWFLSEERDQIAEEILEYASARTILDEIERQYPMLPLILDSVEAAARLAASVRIALSVEGPSQVIESLQSQLTRREAELFPMIDQLQHSDPDHLLRCYSRIVRLANATSAL